MTTRKKHKAKLLAVEAVAGDHDLMKALMKEALQEMLEGGACQDSCRLNHAAKT
jgi:hypothetical protein